MKWSIRSWTPGTSPRDIHDVVELASAEQALAAFEARAVAIKRTGGACEVLTPAGDVAGACMAAGVVRTNDHSATCCCICCVLSNASEPSTPESDRQAQRTMADRWASIEGLLADSEPLTSAERDTRNQ